MSEAATARVQQTEAPKAKRTGAIGLERKNSYGATPDASVAGPVAGSIPFADPRLGHDFSLVPAHTEGIPSRGREGEGAAASAHPALLAEDDTADLGPGQMRKSEFLAQLRSEVRIAAEVRLQDTGRSTDGCPYLEFWFDYYQRKSSAHIERAIRRYAPETNRAATASECIAPIAERVGQSVELWARTGEVTGMPEGIPVEMPGGPGLIGRLASGIGSILFKARESGARSAEDPLAIQAQLGEGRPLDTAVRSRMEPAFGQSFSQVRAHTDAEAAKLSSRMNARAFTIGRDISFARGEYRPGTVMGDALLAHELAHVVQQSGGTASAAPMAIDGGGYDALESDADAAAVRAVSTLWGGTGERMASDATPRLRSGLRLSRCGATCPADVQVAQLHPVPLTADHVRRGWRTGWGAVAEMTVSDAKGTNFNGAKIHENLTPGANTCGNVPNCQNTHGMGGAAGATFEVGTGLGPSEPFSCGPPFMVPSLVFPAKRNTFYDCHLAGFGSSRLHSQGLQSCRQDCQQFYDCNGSRIGNNNFTITREFTPDVINGADVTRIAFNKA